MFKNHTKINIANIGIQNSERFGDKSDESDIDINFTLKFNFELVLETFKNENENVQIGYNKRF